MGFGIIISGLGAERPPGAFVATLTMSAAVPAALWAGFMLANMSRMFPSFSGAGTGSTMKRRFAPVCFDRLSRKTRTSEIYGLPRVFLCWSRK